MSTPPAETDRNLRRRAEEKLGLSGASNPETLTPVDTRELLHEMQVHQIELEMQNEELRQAKAENIATEALLGTYRDLYEFAPAGYFNLGYDGVIHAVNLTGARLLGVERGLLINNRLDAFISDESRPLFHQFLKRVFTNPIKTSCEAVFVSDHHSPVYVQIDAVVAESGKNCRAVAIDISGLKQSEKNLSETTLRLEALMAAVPVGICFSDDITCQRIMGNPVFQEQFTVSTGDNVSASAPDPEALGRKIKYFLEGHEVTDLELPLQRAVLDNKIIPPMELEVVLPSGRNWFAKVSGAPVRDAQGNVIGGIAVIEDITEQKKAQEDLRWSEEQLKLFIDHAPAALAMFDRDMRYLYLSRRWRENFGLGDRDLKGESHYAIFPEIPDHWKEAHRRGLAGEVLRADADRFVQNNGTVHWVHWEIRPWYDSKRDVAGIVIFSEEITARREVEEKIRRLNEELEERVGERTAELESFCYSISHDLRAPLRSLSGFSGILQEDYYEQLDAAGREYLKRIQTAALDMGQLIDNLLNLARVSRGYLSCERVDLSTLAGKIVKTLSEFEPERRVMAVVQEGIEADGDPHFVRILLTNLLGNAWKYTCKESHPKIEFGKRLIEGEPVYFVKDNGVGFDMAHASQLYKPFHRLHGAGEFEGHGIGLATAERIVSRHRGCIWAEGEVGKGATFYFTLPDRKVRF